MVEVSISSYIIVEGLDPLCGSCPPIESFRALIKGVGIPVEDIEESTFLSLIFLYLLLSHISKFYGNIELPYYN